MAEQKKKEREEKFVELEPVKEIEISKMTKIIPIQASSFQRC